MATMFVRHQVADYAKWRRAYDAFDVERKGMGVTSHGVYRTDGSPNNVTIYHEFSSMESAKGFAENPRLKEVMQSAGVQGAPDIWFTNKD